MKVKIYQPAKTTTQSGEGQKHWLIVPIETQNSKKIDDIMGWTSVSNTTSQLKLKFHDKESAINYAKEKGFEFEIIEP